jgi:methylmalonyl-CoA mutase N-terminal domain/subunit
MQNKEEAKKILGERNRWFQEKFSKRKAPDEEARLASRSALSAGVGRKDFYTPLDVSIDYLKDIGFPGQYPFTRGVHPSMYLGRLWTMRQVTGYGTPEETNKRFKYQVSQGQTGLAVVPDTPTRDGYDSDHPMAKGEVGRLGVPLDTIDDMERLFEGLPLDEINPALIESVTGTMIILAMYFALAENKGIPLKKLRGTIQNSCLANSIYCGELNIFPPEHALRIATDIFEYCSKYVPNWNTINVGGYQITEQGANTVQELGISMAFGLTYLESALKRGLAIDSFAPRIAFYFTSGNNFFEEIAKFRAARRMWARFMKEKMGAKDERSMILRYHIQTSAASLPAQEAQNNIIRCTLHAITAVLGGVQSLHVNSFDEALALPTEESLRISLRTQQIIAHESGICDTIDPLGGSYLVEDLTNKIEKEATDLINKIEDIGGGSILNGVIIGIKSGFLAREVMETDHAKLKAIEAGEKVVIGQNKFRIPEEEEPDVTLMKVDPELEKVQRTRLIEMKKERDNTRVKKQLEKLREVAKSDENMMPTMIETVKSHASLGEIVQTLKEVFGFFDRVQII